MTNPRDRMRLRAHLGSVSIALALPKDVLRKRTSASGWSALEHLFHITLANEMSLKNACNLIAERGRLRCELEELDPRAIDILARGRLPLGTQAPRFVAPPAEPDLSLAREIHDDVCKAAEAPELAGELPCGPLGIPHQALGVLTASQWLRFARMHSAHHLRIVRAVLAAT